MKKFLTYFFVVMGVIFTFLLIGLLYLWVADPFNIRLLLSQKDTGTDESRVTNINVTTGTSASQDDENLYLTPAQEDALSLVGIDPGSLPETVTPEQKECFVRVLGAERVNELVSGAVPTVVEIFSTKDCL